MIVYSLALPSRGLVLAQTDLRDIPKLQDMLGWEGGEGDLDKEKFQVRIVNNFSID